MVNHGFRTFTETHNPDYNSNDFSTVFNSRGFPEAVFHASGEAQKRWIAKTGVPDTAAHKLVRTP